MDRSNAIKGSVTMKKAFLLFQSAVDVAIDFLNVLSKIQVSG